MQAATKPARATPLRDSPVGFAMRVGEDADGAPGGLFQLAPAARQRFVESRIGKERQQGMLQGMEPDRHPAVGESPDLGTAQVLHSPVRQFLHPLLQQGIVLAGDRQPLRIVRVDPQPAGSRADPMSGDETVQPLEPQRTEPVKRAS